MKKCSVCGKECKQLRKGMCNRHYRQFMKYGEIKLTIYDSNEIVEYEDYAEVILYNKQCEEVARALIDLEDIEKVKDIKWCLGRNGYVHNKKVGFLHRLIMDCSEDMVVDHINHNILDNRKENLRICTHSQNSMNQSVSNRNTSGVKGVSYDKSRNKWLARITFNQKHINLGRFNTLEEAIEARKQAELEYFGEYRNKEDEE